MNSAVCLKHEHRNSRRRQISQVTSIGSRLAIGAIAIILAGSQVANAGPFLYKRGPFWDTAVVLGGPASKSYRWEYQTRGGIWLPIVCAFGSMSGRTDANGDSRITCSKIASNQGARDRRPLRIRFDNGSIFQEPSAQNTGLRGAVSTIDDPSAPTVIAGLSWQFQQNNQEQMDLIDPSPVNFISANSTVTFSLPEHFTWQETPTVSNYLEADIEIGMVQTSGRDLTIEILSNTEMNPLSGLLIDDASVAFLGGAVPGDYALTMTAAWDPDSSFGIPDGTLSPHDVVAFTVLPEPSSFLLLSMTTSIFALRRRK